MKTIFLIIVLISLQLSVLGQSREEFARMTAAKWQEDLDFLAREYPKRHRNLFRAISREKFDQTINALKLNIPKLSNSEIAVEYAKIAAMIGGGHTEISLTRSAPGFSMFPIQFYSFEGKLFVIAAEKANSKFIGMQLTKIGNTSAEEAFQKAKAIVSRDPDNDIEFMATIPRMLAFAEILQALKITNSSESAIFTLQGTDNEILELKLEPVEYEKISKIEFVRFPAGSSAKLPLPLQNPRDNYWQTYLPESKTVYFKYNACQDQNGKPSLSDFSKQIFESIRQNSAERLVIDMRHNSGGNFHKSEPLIEKIINSPEINQKGKLFVILGRMSYSAAIATAILLKNETNAIFAGEMPRGSPNFLEDVEHMRLPNSKIEVDYSVNNPELPKLKKDLVYFPLDRQMTPSLKDYLAGEDTFLKEILSLN